MKLGLLAKMSLYILIPSLVGLGLVAGVSHQMSENALRKQTRQDIAAILKGQEVGLNAVFQSMKEALAQIITRFLPTVPVISQAEIPPDIRLQSVGTVDAD